MRLPESRFATAKTRRSGGAAAFVLIVSLLVALVAAIVVFTIRARAPIFPIAETENTEDIVDLWNSGEYAALIEVADMRVEDYPLDETALSLRGFARFYLAMQEVNEERTQELLIGSVQDLHRVLLLEEPRLEPEIRYILGKAFFHRGVFFYDSAIEQLTEARSLGVNQLDLLEYLALASRELRLTDDAIAFFEDAIEVGDEAVHKVNLADLLLEEQRFLEADRLLEEVRAGNADVAVMQHALESAGRSFRMQERWDDAIAMYNELLEINESSVAAHYGLGETYLGMGDNNLARYEWREAVRLDPNHIESLQRLQEY